MLLEISPDAPRPSGLVKLEAPTLPCPAIIAREDKHTVKRFLEFFLVTIRNPNTRAAYAKAVWQFLEWCDDRGVELKKIEPLVVAAYIERHPSSPPTIKQHLAAIRMLFDYLVSGGILTVNPAASVRGPKHVVKIGKTPVLTADEMRELFQMIDTKTLIGLRDRALIGVMLYSFARVSAVIKMRVSDYYVRGRRSWFRLHEKGGRFHEVPVHHNAEAYVDAYLKVSGLDQTPSAPLFQSIAGRSKILKGNALSRSDVLATVKRHAATAGLSTKVCNHSFRATGITVFRNNGGTLENAQIIAAHESPQTTRLYDRTSDEISLDEIERILI